jgi:hypothetical protein
MRCAAGFDTLNSGPAYIGGTELGALGDWQLTLPRRERAGFVCNGRRVALTVFGATGTPPALATTVGATVTGVAFLVLGPVAAGYAVRGLGAPLARLRGGTGALARASRCAVPSGRRPPRPR